MFMLKPKLNFESGRTVPKASGSVVLVEYVVHTVAQNFFFSFPSTSFSPVNYHSTSAPNS